MKYNDYISMACAMLIKSINTMKEGILDEEVYLDCVCRHSPSVR